MTQADVNQAADEVAEMLRISREKIEVTHSLASAQLQSVFPPSCPVWCCMQLFLQQSVFMLLLPVSAVCWAVNNIVRPAASLEGSLWMFIIDQAMRLRQEAASLSSLLFFR